MVTRETGAVPSLRRQRWVKPVTLGLSAILVFLTITAFTGFGAPGMMHRYKVRDLRALAESINQKAGPYRTPDDCWRSVYGTEGPLRPIAKVDYVRSRVVVRTYAKRAGASEPNTYNAIVERIDDLIAPDDRFSWRMIQLEPSPDGWSPLVSCSLVTRGYRPATKP